MTAIRLKNQKALSQYLLNYKLRIEKALTYRLEFLIAELQNHAKEAGEYEDQTSNLRGSIGGVLLKDGKPVTYRGFDYPKDEGKEGSTSGLEFINSLISNYRSGYVILIVAGMEYATYVEDIYAKNVLKKTELEMNRKFPQALNEVKLLIR